MLRSSAVLGGDRHLTGLAVGLDGGVVAILGRGATATGSFGSLTVEAYALPSSAALWGDRHAA
ncbi:hypothetical protein ACFWNE_17280 [Streptomyces goshikiensis]|uniref:hypothetical protein n=1 Tax=Streptomyces goshikiensis TaxID=1942 RepID=UPI003655D5EF